MKSAPASPEGFVCLTKAHWFHHCSLSSLPKKLFIKPQSRTDYTKPNVHKIMCATGLPCLTGSCSWHRSGTRCESWNQPALKQPAKSATAWTYSTEILCTAVVVTGCKAVLPTARHSPPEDLISGNSWWRSMSKGEAEIVAQTLLVHRTQFWPPHTNPVLVLLPLPFRAASMTSTCCGSCNFTVTLPVSSLSTHGFQPLHHSQKQDFFS